MVASNQTFIIAAYAVTWAVLLGYQWRLVRKGGRARAEYERMAREQDGEGRQ
jgi:CcmD family protein